MKKLTAAALAVCMTAGMMTGCSAPEPGGDHSAVQGR